MAAYAALVSVMHIIENLQNHPRPPISLHKQQALLLTQKVASLQEFLERYNPHLGYSTEADPLESRIADAAYAAEDVIESHIVDQIKSDREKMSSDALYEDLEKEIEELASIQKEVDSMEMKGVQYQLHTTKSTPLDSMTSSSSSIAHKDKGISMVGADDVKLQLMDKLSSDRPDLQIIPITGMGGRALVSVMRIIEDLQNHPHLPISLHKQQALLLTQKVASLQEFLERYNPHLGYSTEADPLESRIADAADAVEDAIESHIFDQIPIDWEKMSSDLTYSTEADREKMSPDAFYEALEKVIEELASIQKEVDSMEIKGAQYQLQTTKSTPLDSMTSSSSSIAQKGISMVGADDAKSQLMDKLASDRHDLQIIPITGMGGAGKTTLARYIYEDRFTKGHFDICAWVTISQEYSTREMLIEILRQLKGNVDQDLSEHKSGDVLYQHLFGRRYLIIMDDIWSTEAWDRVRRFLPDNKNGSRIVVTTRISNVASQLSYSNSLVEMNLLDEADSWELLSKTVFGVKGRCPVELEEIGRKIAKSCKGLPISIVVVGGILGKSEQTREFWEYIEENINSMVNSEDDERCLKTLHMSYKQLPIHLKPCFLYMGVFREDEVIGVSSLVKLWVAEGFLKPVSGKSLEEIGKENLKDLVDRNLVFIAEVGKTGNMKKCRIHDLVRDLCMWEAQKERFYGVVSSPIHEVGQRRIVISSTLSKSDAVNALSSSMSLVRSLVWNSEYPSDCRMFTCSRLLRVFHPGEPVEVIKFLVNSRLLKLWTPSSPKEFYSFPSSIWQFWNLQTLICPREDTAPTDIWYMPHIRHVQFNSLRLSNPPNDQDGILLGNLQTLCRIMNFKFTEQVIKRIPNIQKLEIFYDCELDEADMNFHYLDKLESLSCCFRNKHGSSPHNLIKFPHSLKKLTLFIERSEYWEDILDKIGVLPLLQKLTLNGGRFREKQWVTTEGQFRSLKFLALVWCNDLKVWTTESSHFPCLEQLHLYGFFHLEEIPLEFAEIPTLRVIHLARCSTSAVESTKRILEEQEDSNGEATIQVQVQVPY